MAKDYEFHFNGTCVIKADSEEDAEAKFWEYIYDEKALPFNEYDILAYGEMEG